MFTGLLRQTRIAACVFTICIIQGSLLPAASAAANKTNPMLHAQGRSLVDGQGREVNLRCVNLSPWLNREGYLIHRNWLALFKSPTEVEGRLAELVGVERSSRFWRDWEDRFIVDSDFEKIRAQGFNCVRLPINHRKVIKDGSDGELQLNEQGVARIDQALNMGSRHQLLVFINLHSAPGGQNNLSTVADVPSYDSRPQLWTGKLASRNQEKTVELWRLLATRYSQSRTLGGYDLLNEPNLPRGVPKSALPRLYERIIAEIRRVDPHHIIILESDNYARDANFGDFDMELDNNLVYSFHAYNWFNPSWAWPSINSIRPYLKLREDHNVPIWLGEFGEDSREWISQMIRLCAEHKVGWAIWPWKRVFIGNNRPAIQTIEEPASWKRLADYLVGNPFTRRPTQEGAERAMSQMLEAISTSRTKEDTGLVDLVKSYAQQTKQSR